MDFNYVAEDRHQVQAAWALWWTFVFRRRQRIFK